MNESSVGSAAIALFADTFASEDLTCISAGLLIRENALPPLVGVAASFLGIYFGDWGLWLAGRLLGQRVMRHRWIASRLPVHRLDRLGEWIDARGARLIIACRFLPGTRLPLYVATGALSAHPGRFATWSFLAAAVWTPLPVLGVAQFGEIFVHPVRFLFGDNATALIATAALILVLVRLAISLCTSDGRARLNVRFERLRRYQFWPAWWFYLPLVPYFLYLSIRYRGLTTITAANPGIPQGGVEGESKFEILSNLPSEWIVPTDVIPAGRVSQRCDRLRMVMNQREWRFPLILKPDAAQRGAGVKLVRTALEAQNYFAANGAAVLVQVYHPGACEAGIFYYRIPGDRRGRIFSITDKMFPELIGDGESTIEELILGHPRFRLQAGVFLARHAVQLDRVLADGERFRLAIAGNHCQGTMFKNGAHLISPELEEAVDRIARRFDGLYIGRFDVRYRDSEALRSGRDIAIVELNGVTSESTNIYDPSWSLWTAYQTTTRLWRLIFAIGDLNRRQGRPATPLIELVRQICSYYSLRQITMLAD